MMRVVQKLAWSIALLCCLYVPALPLQAALSDEIFDIVEAAAVGEDRHLLPEPVRAGELIYLFYQQRDYKVAWEGRERVNGVLEVLAESSRHGLDPDDYHYSVLRVDELPVALHKSAELRMGRPLAIGQQRTLTGTMPSRNSSDVAFFQDKAGAST